MAGSITLMAPARPGAAQILSRIRPQDMGLKPLELEVWQGFVMVRFKPGPQPSVAELMRPFRG